MDLDADCVGDCMRDNVCQVCGLPVGLDGFVVVARDSAIECNGVLIGSMVLDSGPLHQPCLAMSVKMCPHLRDLAAGDALCVVGIADAGCAMPLSAAVRKFVYAAAVAPWDPSTAITRLPDTSPVPA
jgi:hypothetical protein